jgi:hypothetical protein
VRVALAALALMMLAGCAHGGTRYELSPVTLTVPAHDNAAPLCTVAEIPVTVPDTTFRVVYLRVTQGAWAYTDSLVTYASRGAVTFALPAPPTGAIYTLDTWARDRAGAGCHATATRTPLAVTIFPARPVIQ